MTIQAEENEFCFVDRQENEADKFTQETVSYWKDAWNRLKKNPIAMISLFVVILLIVMCIIGPELQGYDYVAISSKDKNLGSSRMHWLGTDNMGRDLFARIWAGVRVSLVIALSCTVIKIVIGSLYGGIMGYFGGTLDEIMMRIIEIIDSIPGLLFTIIIMIALGNNMFAILLAFSITSWCGTARQIRGQVMQLREMEYIMAAQTLGVSTIKILLGHLLPNTMGFLILDVATSIPGYIFQKAGLSFLGLGLTTPTISLGLMISAGQQVMNSYPAQLLWPALVLSLIVLAFNLFGDGLRDALDPKLRR